MGIKIINETGNQQLDSIAEELTKRLAAVDWASSCGKPTDRYDDGASTVGPLTEIKLKEAEKKGAEAYNQSLDKYSTGGGGFGDYLWIDSVGLQNVVGHGDPKNGTPPNYRSPLATFIHEILHGTAAINYASRILAEEYLKEHPLLNPDEQAQVKKIFEEAVLRAKVEEIARASGSSLLLTGGDSGIRDLSREAFANLVNNKYPGVLKPKDRNKLIDYLTGMPKLGDTCGFGELLPLHGTRFACEGPSELFELAENTISPLILDLDGDGVETLGQNFYIQFDHDKNGFAERTGWVGADDGLLVLDRNGNGQIDNGSELFGNNSGTGPGLRWRARWRRPPLDPMNALLSFLYTLLTHECRSACEAVGLDPAVGFLHRDRPGRPSLALDLMEELRAPLADRLALSLTNRRQLRDSDFRRMESGAVMLTDDARKTVLTAWQDRKREERLHDFLNEKAPLGLVPHLQAQLLARHLRGDIDAYPPWFWN
jgi:hypothetical protein